MQAVSRAFRRIAVGAAVLVGTNVVLPAQPPATTPPTRGETMRGPGARHDRAALGERRNQDRRLGRALFRDITLTDAQRTQVQAIQRKYADERAALAKSLRAQTGGSTGQRPDSAQRAQLRARLQTEGRSLMERQVADIRAVLSPEQRATFDKNVAQSRDRLQARFGGARDKGARRAPGPRA